MIRVAVLVSGSGTNLQALLDHEQAGTLDPAKIAVVISNRRDAFALERAKKAGIPAFTVTKKPTEDEWDEEVLEILKAHQVQLVVLAGFLRKLSARFIAAYPDRILNIHPSLLPSFGGQGFYGLHVHKAVLSTRTQITGATVHIVSEEMDRGPILLQKAVEVVPDDTPETLQKRVMKEAEWILLPLGTTLLARRLAAGKSGEALRAPLSHEERFFALALPDAIEKTQAIPPESSLPSHAQSGTQVSAPVPVWELVDGNPYPGRGIALAHGKNGETLVCYFIMGRSSNSQNRVFRYENGDLYTQAQDPALVEDPSLIIYRALSHPTLSGETMTLVTNGDQTETILTGFSQGLSFDESLKSRRFEPDSPHFTPRISGVISKKKLHLSIWKSLNAHGAQAGYFSFDYEAQPGIGYFLSTYDTNGTVLPSFSGEPRRFLWNGDGEVLTENLWNALDSDHRIALFVEVTESDGTRTHWMKSRFSA